MKVGELVRFKSCGDYKQFHGHVGLVVSTEEAVISGTGKRTLHLAVKWLKPVLYDNRIATKSHFNADRYEVLS